MSARACGLEERDGKDQRFHGRHQWVDLNQWVDLTRGFEVPEAELDELAIEARRTADRFADSAHFDVFSLERIDGDVDALLTMTSGPGCFWVSQMARDDEEEEQEGLYAY